MAPYFMPDVLIAFFILQLFKTTITIENSSSPSKELLLKIKRALEIPVLKVWTYGDRYKEFANLLITPNLTDKSLLHDGKTSEKSIGKQLLRALNGQDVTLYIFGESVSVGADLGKNNVRNIYHYALADWWNETIGHVTNSYMFRRNIAVGGVGTNYFSKCWKEYLSSGDKFDMALWEFNINDFDDEMLNENTETFIRSIYTKYESLDLMFTIFYRDSWFSENNVSSRGIFHDISRRTYNISGRWNKMAERWHSVIGLGPSHKRRNEIKIIKNNNGLIQRRHDISETIILKLAKRYNLSCFNIEAYINSTSFLPKQQDLFVNIHPSILAHAQMALSIIHYYRETILKYINTWLLDNRRTTYYFEPTIGLPAPYFVKNDLYNTICWTAVITENLKISRLKHSLFQLDNNATSDFTSTLQPMNTAEARTDMTGGYTTNQSGGYMFITFEVPTSVNNTCDVLAALRYQDQTSLTKVTLYDSITSKVTTTQNISSLGKESRLYVNFIHTVQPGTYTIKFTPLKGGMLLSALIIC